MKALMTKIFWPILRLFETNTSTENYKPSHRKILLAVGVLFFVLSIISGWAMYATAELGAILPIAIFFLAGFVSIIVGALGSDGAIAKIWGNR